MVADTRFVQGAQKLSQRIRTIRTTLSVELAVDEAAQFLLRRTLTRFENQVDPDGEPWKALTSSTLARRKRAGGYPGKKILQQTEALKGSIRVIRGSAAGSLYINTGVGRRIGVTDPKQTDKAFAHQRGTPTIPVRRFLGVSRLDVKAVDALLRRRAIDAGIE